MSEEYELPTKPHTPEVNANSMILFGKEKCGKTTALSLLENCLIIDTERGSAKVKATAIQVPQDRGPVGKMAWLKGLANKLKESDIKYDYIGIDTLTEVNDWAEYSGTYRYMNSIQGKSFNRVKDAKGVPIKGGEFLSPDEDDYQTVHSLPDGNGYKWSREEVMAIFNMFMGLANKCVIFVCHIEDKFIGLKDTTDQIVPKQLALTGKLRDMLPRKVDAIGYVYTTSDGIKVNFAGDEQRIGGSRAKHLQGYNGILDWKVIFI